MLEQDDWNLDRTRVPGKPGDDLGAGTLNSVLKQAGLKK
jgi:predicted RNA binding protein YcfA (HicA-like mRNA interferase family)